MRDAASYASTHGPLIYMYYEADGQPLNLVCLLVVATVYQHSAPTQSCESGTSTALEQAVAKAQNLSGKPSTVHGGPQRRNMMQYEAISSTLVASSRVSLG